MAKLPTERRAPSTWSVFSFSSFNCQQTTWSQTDVVRMLSRSFTNMSANRPPLCHLAEHPQPSLQPREDVTETSHLSAFPMFSSFLSFFFSFSDASSTRPLKINPHAALLRPVQNSLPSEFNTATLEKSSDKDRATLTVHIRTFENTLQQLTHIQPTECTYEQKKKKKKKIIPVIRYILHSGSKPPAPQKDAKTK